MAFIGYLYTPVRTTECVSWGQEPIPSHPHYPQLQAKCFFHTAQGQLRSEEWRGQKLPSLLFPGHELPTSQPFTWPQPAGILEPSENNPPPVSHRHRRAVLSLSSPRDELETETDHDRV